MNIELIEPQTLQGAAQQASSGDVMLQQRGAIQGAGNRSLMATPTPGDLLRIALESGADLDRLERLMDLQAKWEAGEARKAFVQAMTEFKAEPLEIFKRKAVGYTTKDGAFVGYKHAELSDVADVVVPAMARHGLSHRWDVKQEPKKITVTCTITHKAGHSESVMMDAAPDDSGKKNSIQQVASTITYLQRYTLLASTGLATKSEHDDDGAGAGAADDAVPKGADAEAFEAMLDGFRAAALNGSAALKQHYINSQPSADFWKIHSRALKAAAANADAEAGQ
jgi:hypothetical protein